MNGNPNDYKQHGVSQPPKPMNELAMQNMIRKRYCRNWPDTILQLTKRVQAVNQTWVKIVMQVMTIPGLRISWYRSVETDAATTNDSFVVEIRIGDVYEFHEITAEELQDAHQYIEVLIMDKLDHSKLIAKHTGA